MSLWEFKLHVNFQLINDNFVYKLYQTLRQKSFNLFGKASNKSSTFQKAKGRVDVA